MQRSILRKVGIEESEDSHLKRPVNIINKIIDENLPNLTKRNKNAHNGKRKEIPVFA